MLNADSILVRSGVRNCAPNAGFHRCMWALRRVIPAFEFLLERATIVTPGGHDRLPGAKGSGGRGEEALECEALIGFRSDGRDRESIECGLQVESESPQVAGV